MRNVISESVSQITTASVVDQAGEWQETSAQLAQNRTRLKLLFVELYCKKLRLSIVDGDIKTTLNQSDEYVRFMDALLLGSSSERACGERERVMYS